MILVIGGRYETALRAIAQKWARGRDRQTLAPGHVVIDGAEYLAISGQDDPSVLRGHNGDVQSVEIVDTRGIRPEMMQIIREKGWA